MISGILPYILMFVTAGLLATAQSLWAHAVKVGKILEGSLPTILINAATNWRILLGIFLYILATAAYFYMVSKLKFFSVQIAMTAISIIFSVALSILLFQEKPSIINVVGILLVFIGITLVLHK